MRFKYHPSEHGFLGCRVGDGDLFIYVNLVGTFGVASTPYQWARIAGCQIRVTHYMVGPGPGLELLLYADDLEALGIGRAGEPARFFFWKSAGPVDFWRAEFLVAHNFSGCSLRNQIGCFEIGGD